MAAATQVSGTQPFLSREVQAGQSGFYLNLGLFTFPAGQTTCTIVVPHLNDAYLGTQATYTSAVVASDGPLYVTRSGNTLTVGRAAATTSAPTFSLAVWH